MGNNTYYYIDDEVWLYIPEGDILYYKEENDLEYTAIPINNLTSRITNEVTEYNVSDLMSNIGKYYFSTNPSKYYQKCELLRIDTGDIEIDNINNTATISNYSNNLDPLYYEIYRFYKGSTDSSVFPAPPNCVAGRIPNSEKYITENTFSITKPTGANILGFYIRVYYKNEFGLAYKDSNFITY